VEALQRRPPSDQETEPRRFEQIIGRSPVMESVLALVERVAPTEATVLIQGDTGTGKELIAKAIHTLSPRYGRPLVKINCAAIPLDLLESELFGHEKGAFTGAVTQKVGRFELAERGTLFLDEVGDMPMALQPKLLRVLQEQEVERLGGTRTYRVDARVVAATNRDLTEMVASGTFRADLFYRLNVFPILLPPLRERRDDIPDLVAHYVDTCARRLNTRIQHIPPAAMSALRAYDWPGNIRELRNVIERAVILSDDGVLAAPWLPSPASARRVGAVVPAAAANTTTPTFKDAERRLIVGALEAVGWVIGGAKGAAARLGLNRTTLIHKMKRLGIERPKEQDEA
jgi:formate hydrogenlyase transcriptional activator